jgi:hypothetical protein
LRNHRFLIVYTAYLEAPGAPRRWMLQYCVPGTAPQQYTTGAGGVIHVQPKRPVQPPFPVERGSGRLPPLDPLCHGERAGRDRECAGDPREPSGSQSPPALH